MIQYKNLIKRKQDISNFLAKQMTTNTEEEYHKVSSKDIENLAKQSEVGFKIIDENIPVNNETYETALKLNIGPVTCAMNGGEDYELLFTISREGYEKLKTHFDIVGIGEVVPKEQGINIITKAGRSHPITAQGWDHFEKEEE